MAIILNITEETFFVYDGEYKSLLAMLFEKQKCGASRWRQSDKIVFVEEHLIEFVTKKYDRIYLEAEKVAKKGVGK